MKRWSWISLIVLVTAAGIGFYAIIIDKSEQDVRKEAFRQQWYTEHKCKPGGYTGRERRMYICDDGVPYTWYDLPTQEFPTR